jgi:hypothetical protein
MEVNFISIRWPHFDYAFLLHFWECWEELLRVVIVERSWSSVVLSGNHDNGLNFGMGQKANTMFFLFVHCDTWHVMESLFRSLKCILSGFDWVLSIWSEPWMVSPATYLCVGFFFLLFLSLSRKGVPPCDSSAEIVPVCISVKWNGKPDRPKDPSHLPYHPDISLTHIIGNMEHHFAN